MPYSIEAVPWGHPEGDDLRRAQRRELDARYGRDDHEPGTPPSAADIDVFLIARDDGNGTAVACGALRRLGEHSCEVKRMYVDPAHRGTGVSTAVLRALETAAISRGWTRLRLETGTAQPDAMRFYEREGYSRIEPFGAYIGSSISVCYERRLDGDAVDIAEAPHG